MTESHDLICRRKDNSLFSPPASVMPLFFHALYEPVYIVNSPADMLKFIQDITLFYFYFQNPLFDLLKIALFGNLIHKDTPCSSFYLFFADRAIMNIIKNREPGFLCKKKITQA